MKNPFLLGAIDWNNPQEWPPEIIVLGAILAVVGIVLTIVSLIWFTIWIKYSWFHTNNSANLTGGQVAKIYLDKYGVNAPRIKFAGNFQPKQHILVESKYFYLSPYLIRDNTLHLRLLPWTYHRKSIYTMAMALESAWAISSSKSSRFNTFWWDFSRKITIVFVLLPFILAVLFALGPILNIWSFANANSSIISIVLSCLGSVILILFSVMQLRFYGKSRNEICHNLTGILNNYEIRAIRSILTIKFVYFIVRTIYEIIELILKIVIYINQKKE